MAVPRVFISSTCYDLSEVRDSLSEFIHNYGFVPMLSEKGDVFYHPDLHTHECCVSEVSKCDLFVLIIGGRFGGQYIIDKTKSITNAEYQAAKQCGLPIFTFVKSEVSRDHLFYIKNNKSNDIYYPSIDKQEHSIEIFKFIDEVRKSNTNNGFFEFYYTKDIISMLKKQWSGMFYEFLEYRKMYAENKAAKQLLDTINIASMKTEEIIKNIYLQVDSTNANIKIQELDNFYEVEAFIVALLERFEIEEFEVDEIYKINEDIDEVSEFLVCIDNRFNIEFTSGLDSNGNYIEEDVLWNTESVKGFHWMQ